MRGRVIYCMAGLWSGLDFPMKPSVFVKMGMFVNDLKFNVYAPNSRPKLRV